MEDFKTHITDSDLADPTKKVHLKNIETLGQHLDKPIKKIIKHLKTNVTINQQFQINKTLSKYLQFMKRDDDREVLLDYAKTISDKMTKQQQTKTCDIKKGIEEGTIKTREQLLEALDELYNDGEWKKYIINYLLFHFHTRNKDLNVTIVKRKMDTKDENTNYLWLKKKAVDFIRKDYKTKDLYGNKTYTITDPKFIAAVKQYGETNLLNTNNLAREVKNNTIDKLTESQVNKIFIYSLPITELSHISQSRGTSLQTLVDRYNPNKCL